MQEVSGKAGDVVKLLEMPAVGEETTHAARLWEMQEAVVAVVAVVAVEAGVAVEAVEVKVAVEAVEVKVAVEAGEGWEVGHKTWCLDSK